MVVFLEVFYKGITYTYLVKFLGEDDCGSEGHAAKAATEAQGEHCVTEIITKLTIQPQYK